MNIIGGLRKKSVTASNIQGIILTEVTVSGYKNMLVDQAGYRSVADMHMYAYQKLSDRLKIF